MGNSFEKSSCETPFLGQVEYSEPLGNADFQLFHGNIDEAWEEYLRVFKEEKEVESEDLVNLMIGLWRECYSRMTYHNDDVCAPRKAIEVFSCRKCWGLIFEPCTLSCGHTLCRKCIGKPDNFVVCYVCKEPTQLDKWPSRTNVTLAEVIRKWFPAQSEAARLRLQGNTCFSKKNYKKSIERYTEGLIKNPSDHLLLGNRSNVYFVTGEYHKALEDADQACRVKPRWSKLMAVKGRHLKLNMREKWKVCEQTALYDVILLAIKAHYRKAVASMALKRYAEASVSFLTCILLDASNITVHKNLKKALHALLVQESKATRSVRGGYSQEMQALTAGQKLHREESMPVSSNATSVHGSMDLDSSMADRQHVETEVQAIKDTDKTCPISSVTRNPLREIVDSFSKYSTRSEDVAPVLAEVAAEFSKEIGEAKLRSALDDLECPLCCRIFYEPTTTPCGHMFCKSCLTRSLDHNLACPFCRFSLIEFVRMRKKVTTDVVNQLLALFYDSEVKDRIKKAKEELEDLAKVATDTEEDIPIFVCTIALPTLPCPLHIFEPRYRLMLRQCIESGSQQFGMTMYDEEKGFADYGCMVEIKAVNYLNDGRALVDTIGGRRFKVLSRGVRDGYRTAKVEWIHDSLGQEGLLRTYRTLNQQVYSEAKAWFQSLAGVLQARITSSFGRFPDCCEAPEETTYGPKWTWWMLQLIIDSPATQLSFLASKSPIQRLQDISMKLRGFS